MGSGRQDHTTAILHAVMQECMYYHGLNADHFGIKSIHTHTHTHMIIILSFENRVPVFIFANRKRTKRRRKLECVAPRKFLIRTLAISQHFALSYFALSQLAALVHDLESTSNRKHHRRRRLFLLSNYASTSTRYEGTITLIAACIRMLPGTK